MLKKKITRKELLKEPDEFLTFSARMLQWILQNKDRIFWGAAALIFVAAAGSGWMYYRNIREKKAIEAFGKIMATYRQVDEGTVSGEKMGQTKEMLAAFFKEYPGTGSGKMGRVLYANLCFQGGDQDSAITAYQDALDDYKDNPLLRNVILSSIGHAYLKKQQPDQAAKYFEQVASGDVPLLKDEALFILANLSGKAGNTEARSEKFKQILADFPDSFYSTLVKEEIGGAK